MEVVGRAAADWALDIFMCEAVNSGWSKQKVTEAKFMRTKLGSSRVCKAMEASAGVTNLVVVGK